jgi:hypothetical protein
MNRPWASEMPLVPVVPAARHPPKSAVQPSALCQTSAALHTINMHISTCQTLTRYASMLPKTPPQRQFNLPVSALSYEAFRCVLRCHPAIPSTLSDRRIASTFTASRRNISCMRTTPLQASLKVGLSHMPQRTPSASEAMLHRRGSPLTSPVWRRHFPQFACGYPKFFRLLQRHLTSHTQGYFTILFIFCPLRPFCADFLGRHIMGISRFSILRIVCPHSVRFFL